MIKVGHIGVFNTNIGDTAATYNIEKSWRALHPDTEWYRLNLKSFWGHKNKVSTAKGVLKELEEKVDVIIVGGGGLLEYGGYEQFGTGWKLPFNEEVLSAVTKPIHFHAVGLNIFRGGVPYSKKAKEALQACIDMSSTFSVRNDGSYQKLRDWVGLDVSRVHIVPDPGLLHYDHLGIKRKSIMEVGAIQPAWNGGEGINNNRYGGKDNIKYLNELFKSYKMIPHTKRDFRSKGTPVLSKHKFEKMLGADQFDSFVQYYKEIDYVVAFRGHGQMMSIGMNVPGIYLSTQDKVEDFSLNNGFQNFNVDIKAPWWRAELEHKLELLTKPDSPYLRQWYDIRDQNMKVWYGQDAAMIKSYIHEL